VVLFLKQQLNLKSMCIVHSGRHRRAVGRQAPFCHFGGGGASAAFSQILSTPLMRHPVEQMPSTLQRAIEVADDYLW